MIHKSFNRRKFLKAAFLGTAATALAACAPQTVTVEVTRQVEKQVEVTKEVVKEVEKNVEVTKEVIKEVAVTAVPVELKGELTVWGHADHPLDNAGQAFMAKNPGVKFTFVGEDGWDKKVEAALAAGSGLPDMVWYEADATQVAARRGILLDVTEMVKKHESELVPSKLAEARYQGKYYGMPGDITPNNYWYRTDITEKAGAKDINPDIKYDEFLQLSKDVKAKTGASMYVMNSNFTGQGILPFLVPHYSLGGNVSDESGENIVIDNEIGQQAMNYAKQAWDLKAGLDADWFSPPYWGAIKEGKLGGTWSPPWMRGFFETEVTSPERGQGKWRNMLVPAYPGGKARCNVWGGATLCGFKTVKDPALVMAYMEYTFASIEGATVTGNWGIIPPYLPWLKGYFKLTKASLFEPTWDWTGQIVKALDQMRTDFYRLPAYGVMMGSLDKFGLPMLKGEKPIKDGMQEWGDYIRAENKKLLEAIK
ncbi:MAG: extracellular solute-binding protein [Chloroflexi bacterium]|nr:extracellular solute-binding protein [Chloroflexota bacterium]MCL5275782.1 extracellular solute-binding protein [Chloroflexota bacterium]